MRRASFDWIAFLPVLPFFEGFDADEIDELAASGGVLELPRAAFLEIHNGASGATASLHHAIHRSLMRSIARTNTQLTRLISHARLSSAGENAAQLEAALHGQIWRADEARP